MLVSKSLGQMISSYLLNEDGYLRLMKPKCGHPVAIQTTFRKKVSARRKISLSVPGLNYASIPEFSRSKIILS